MMRRERGPRIGEWRVPLRARSPRRWVHSATTRATTTASRPCRLRGVPTPKRVRIKSPEIEAADVDEQPLQDVRVPAQMRAPHPAGLVQMRIRAFQSLARGAAARPARARRGCVDDSRTRRRGPRRLRLPPTPAAVRLGDVGAQIRAPPDRRAPDCCGTPCPPRPRRSPPSAPSVASATASSSSAAAVTVSAIVVVSP